MRDYETGEGLSEEDNEAFLMISTNDPVQFEEAIKSEKWRRAMDAEMEAIQKNNTWELTELPKGAKKYGVDYTELFAPVARIETVRLVLAFTAQRGWTIYQLDVKSTFLHGELTESVFVEQPRGYIQRGKEGKVYKLKKALYGLKQAPRA
ncbi:UNVERIFIED_CONTAM: Retrovirus-related Pol polyprotein from transposon RE1 [Sesamum latifolium]|uniref:Retrovirus-related Pol polyprotein from transposon RE1 n=1 Tax=Sesamum latifolium TaxID=2727402 RepID=A0AAW2VXR0_9LAMI